MFSSIRTKLTLWYVAVLAITIITFSVVAYLVMVNRLKRETDEQLVEMGRNFDTALRAELEDETGTPESEKAIPEVVNEMQFRDYHFLIFTKQGRKVASTANFDLAATPLTDAAFQNVEVDQRPTRAYQTLFVNGQNEYRLFVFHSLHEQNALMSRLAGIFLAGVPLTLILAGFGGYFLTRKTLSPMVEIGRQAAQISAQNLHERISIKNKNDELGDLAAVFNELLARLDASFEQQQRFMADASHELRTPLAILRGEAEVTLSKKDRRATDYQESLSIVHDESKRLTGIVEDLFTLARADAGQFPANMSPVYLDEIAGDAVRTVRVLADRKQIGLSFNADTEMPFAGDEPLLRRMFLNVLDNAIKYTPPGGSVGVECRTDGEMYKITVTDSGIGIPPGERQKIFERFYRVDKARSRSDTDISGAGLGLSISQWIADIHSGKISLMSSGENGSIFSIEFVRQDQ